MSALLAVGIGAGALGLLLVSIGAGLVASAWRFGRHAEPAQGTVVSLRLAGTGDRIVAGPGSRASRTPPGEGRFYLPTVRFKTRDGREIEAESQLGANPPPGRVGELVALRYDTRCPERFRLDRVTRSGGFVAVAFIFGGLPFLLVGIGLLQAA